MAWWFKEQSHQQAWCQLWGLYMFCLPWGWISTICDFSVIVDQWQKLRIYFPVFKIKSDWKELMSYFFREVKSKFLDLILGYSAHWSSSDLPSASPDTVAVEATTKGQPHVSSAVTTPRPKLVTVATQTEGTGQSAGTILIQNGRFCVGQISFFCLIFPWAKGPISQRHN